MTIMSREPKNWLILTLFIHCISFRSTDRVNGYKSTCRNTTDLNDKYMFNTQENDRVEENIKEKISRIDQQWLLDTMKLRKSRNKIVRSYVGSVSRLPCNLYFPPSLSIDIMQPVWMYSKSTKNISFSIIEKETSVMATELTIYYTKPEDAGYYQCKIRKSFGGLVSLEVIENEKYTVVKPLSSRGPYPTLPEIISKDLIIFSYWYPWSECSTCNVVGRRRRYGICFVALITYKKLIKNSAHHTESMNSEIFELFQAYPDGIPCRSHMLPPSILTMPKVESRHNEIMIGLCKVPCKDGISEVRSNSGEILEQANNSAGIYSLRQDKPLQPPEPAREIIFALPGTKIFIICPGTILRDIPITWRVGNKLVTPRKLDTSSSGRVHLNARDHIVFKSVEYTDANVYSCWQTDILAGVIKLEVLNSTEEICRNRFTLVAIIICLGLVLRFTRGLFHYGLRVK